MTAGGHGQCSQNQEGDSEGEHGGRPHTRRERHPAEESGYKLPADERQGGRGSSESADGGHYGQGHKVDGRSGEIDGRHIEEYEPGEDLRLNGQI